MQSGVEIFDAGKERRRSRQEGKEQIGNKMFFCWSLDRRDCICVRSLRVSVRACVKAPDCMGTMFQVMTQFDDQIFGTNLPASK